MYYNTCPKCGAHLDPGEKCDCIAVMSEAAKAARAAYRKEWRRKNPEKQREYTARYWEKKAAQNGQ